jgi:hypothetical protein
MEVHGSGKDARLHIVADLTEYGKAAAATRRAFSPRYVVNRVNNRKVMRLIEVSLVKFPGLNFTGWSEVFDHTDFSSPGMHVVASDGLVSTITACLDVLSFSRDTLEVSNDHGDFMSVCGNECIGNTTLLFYGNSSV